MTGAAVYRATVAHVRTAPVRYRFAARYAVWLVDLDDLPRLPGPLTPLLRFSARDHLGDPSATIRANLDAFLARRGLERPDRVLMLANPRSFGHAFNPLSLHWCYRGERLRAVVAEVHNTYGGRHGYLLRPDRDGRAEADKVLYVSPFFPVDGRYEMQTTEPGGPLDVRIALRRGGTTVFQASLRAPAPVPVREVVATALRHPLPGWWASARIRRHGVALRRRGLPVEPRDGPGEPAQEVA